jgi:two-component system LytT family sensor kinase
MRFYQFKWYRLVASALTGIVATFLIFIAYDIANLRIVRIRSYVGTWSFLWGVIFFMVSYEILSIVNRRIDKNRSWYENTKKRFIYQFFIDFLFIALISIPTGWFISGFIAADRKIDYLEDALIIGAVAMVCILMLVVFELTVFFLSEWKSSQLLVEKFRKENLEYRFDRLKEQLNPHFLFNNLNTLYSLINENPEKASEFVLELSDIYRYVLKNKDEEIISLKEELDFTNSYIYLISNRFVNSIDISVQLPEKIYHSKIPPLTLQMLIENAIKHNSFDKTTPLKINIFKSQNKIVIDNELQLKIEKEKTNKVGLLNLKERYRFLSGEDIEIIKTETKFIVKLPIIN